MKWTPAFHAAFIPAPGLGLAGEDRAGVAAAHGVVHADELHLGEVVAHGPVYSRAMPEESPLRPTEHGLAPETDGWFVLNAREARWMEDGPFGYFTRLGGEGEAKFKQMGVNLAVLEPGQPACLYHREDEQEDFLILSGECLLLVEGEERTLRAWDFFHCPPMTEHVLVGAGDEPCTVLLMGTRTDGAAVVYPESDLARSHSAGVEKETDSPAEAYAPYPTAEPVDYREGWLP